MTLPSVPSDPVIVSSVVAPPGCIFMHSGSLDMLIGFAAGAGPSNLTTPDSAAGAPVSEEAPGLVAAPGTALFTSAHVERVSIARIISRCFGLMVLRPPFL